MLSCQREDLSDTATVSINELTSNLENEIMYRTQLRLSFGKTIANALENKHFRKYIKDKSLVDTYKYFNELPFGIHRDDIVENNKTLYDFLKSFIDQEVKDLFGNDFLDLVLQDDPLVAIKTPDIFYHHDWDIQNYSPMVYVKTPVRFDNDGFFSYMAYHYGGYQEKVPTWTKPSYFCVVIKYSEDYILWNENEDINEKNIHINSLFPYISSSFDEIKSEVIDDNILLDASETYYYIFKKDIYQSFRNTVQINEAALVINQDPPCDDICHRNCADIDELNNILKSIHPVHSNTFGLYYGSFTFRETMNFNMLFYDKKAGDIYTAFSTNGFRYNDLYAISSNISCEVENVKYNGVNFALPKMNVEINYNDANTSPIEIGLEITRGWPGSDPLKSIGYQTFLLEYDDVTNTVSFPLPPTSSFVSFPASNGRHYQTYSIHYCDGLGGIYDNYDLNMEIIY